jgi:adenylate cyclase
MKGPAMADSTVQRRLAAILAADVAGYSALMEADEEGTRAALHAARAAVLDPAVARHNGRLFKEMGDGFLVEFASVISATECALDIQAGMAAFGGPEGPRIAFRIGVNLGDVIVEGDDLHGDGVNVAARLEGLADPGGLCLSATVHDQVRRRIAATFDDMGPQRLKNIREPLRVFRLRGEAETPAPAPRPPPPCPCPCPTSPRSPSCPSPT